MVDNLQFRGILCQALFQGVAPPRRCRLVPLDRMGDHAPKYGPAHTARGTPCTCVRRGSGDGSITAQTG